jgi:anti-sigma regulatory factor (Ser/Thr protein kinase)
MALSLVGRPRRKEWTAPPLIQVVAAIRREVRNVLVRWRLSDEVIDDALLVVHEFLVNVVQHARTTFRLVVELRGRRLYVAVDDEAVGPVPAGRAGLLQS